MADRFWVGGSGTWNTASTANWSTTSGGSPGASVPTSSDDVYFNGASGAVTVQIGSDSAAYSTCKNLDFTGFTGTFNWAFVTNSRNLYCYGSLTIGSNTTFINQTSGPSIEFKATTSGHTITTNGKSCPGFRFNGTGGVWTLQDNLTISKNNNSPISISSGRLNTNGKTISADYFSGSSSAAGSVLDMTNSTITLTRTSGNMWYANDADLTIISTGSTIIASGSGTVGFDGGGKTYNNLEIQGSGSFTIIGSNTFNDLKTGTRAIKFTDGTTQTITSLTTTGGSLYGTSTGGWTLTKPTGTVQITNCAIAYSTVTGGATWNGINCTNIGNNTGWNFLYSVTLTAQTGTFNVLFNNISINRVSMINKDKPTSIITNQNKP